MATHELVVLEENQQRYGLDKGTHQYQTLMDRKMTTSMDYMESTVCRENEVHYDVVGPGSTYAVSPDPLCEKSEQPTDTTMQGEKLRDAKIRSSTIHKGIFIVSAVLGVFFLLVLASLAFAAFNNNELKKEASHVQQSNMSDVIISELNNKVNDLVQALNATRMETNLLRSQVSNLQQMQTVNSLEVTSQLSFLQSVVNSTNNEAARNISALENRHSSEIQSAQARITSLDSSLITLRQDIRNIGSNHSQTTLNGLESRLQARINSLDSSLITLRRDIRNIGSNHSRTTSSLNSLESRLQAHINSLDSSLITLRRDIRNIGSNHSRTTSSLNSLESRLQAHINSLDSSLITLRRDIRNIGSNHSRTTSSLNSLESRLRRVNMYDRCYNIVSVCSVRPHNSRWYSCYTASRAITLSVSNDKCRAFWGQADDPSPISRWPLRLGSTSECKKIVPNKAGYVGIRVIGSLRCAF